MTAVYHSERTAGAGLTSSVRDVPAEEPLPLPPVHQARTFEQQRRCEDVAGDRGQDVDGRAHLRSLDRGNGHEPHTAGSGGFGRASAERPWNVTGCHVTSADMIIIKQLRS